MEPINKQLISAFSSAWNDMTPSIIECDTALNVLALREVNGDGMAGALAVAATWSTAFVVPCSGAASGLLIFLVKAEEGAELDHLARQPVDGTPLPGGRSLVASAASAAAAALAATLPSPIAFGEVTHLDLSADESRLASIVGDSMWVGTCSLSVGDSIDTQALLLYAPNGSMDAAAPRPAAQAPAPAAPAPGPAAAAQPAPATRRNQRREEQLPRNLERVLDVELDVIVRFGVTSKPLRDVVQMGVGTMIELNRAVDEPVELLVNGRPLARGEVVVVDGYYGVRITEMGSPADRALAIG
jgi:flagellar motor switch protein FliN